MKIGSLFSGIGGLELGLEAAGVGKTAWQIEKDPFCRAVLEKHWPDVRRYEDVCAVGAHDLEPVEVIAGGFPCQDISNAGKQAGLKGARSGLWFEYARIVEEVMPRFVVVENVAALVNRGLDEVLRSLAALGYDAEWSVLRASDVGRILRDDRYGARHRRERLFIIAWRRDLADAEGRHGAGSSGRVDDHRQPHREVDGAGLLDVASDQGRGNGASVADAYGQQRPRQGHEPHGVRAQHAGVVSGGTRESGVGLVAQSAQAPFGRMGVAAHGVLARLDVARPGEKQKPWEQPRTCVEQQDRAKRLRALGNAVVPAAAYVVGLRLLQIDASLRARG